MKRGRVEPAAVVPTEPCTNCEATGLVDGGYKVRRTCPVCRGMREVPIEIV